MLRSEYEEDELYHPLDSLSSSMAEVQLTIVKAGERDVERKKDYAGSRTGSMYKERMKGPTMYK